MKEYVLGFQITPDDNVVMIKKTKPMWQAGKLNGVGGKIEDRETPLQAMIREFEEETSVHYEKWIQYTTIRGDGFVIHVFASVANEKYEYKTMTEEEVYVVPIFDCFGENINKYISNIPWLLSMMSDEDVFKNGKTIEVVYK